MVEDKGRPPPAPLEYVRLEAGAGEFRVAMGWQPRTGILKFKVSGSEGNELSISKKFAQLKAEKVSDVIQSLREVFGEVLADADAAEAASKMVSGMMSILPDGKKREASS